MFKLLPVFFILTLFLFTVTSPIFARVTPEDIVNSQKDAYNEKVKTYTSSHQQSLETLSTKIAQANTKNTSILASNLARQAQILDEYDRRKGFPTDDEDIKKARYWLTFAHEAVDYQAAKIYVFSLTSESNIKNDALNTIAKMQSELNYARGTVIKSQGIIADLVE